VTRWKLISVLLEYPEPEVEGAGEELARTARGVPPLERFLAWRGAVSLDEQRREYVQTFDFDRRATLYLTYHTHGDRRQRGLELVRLKRRFREAGHELSGSELPDYLPALLEFAALAPDEGPALLAQLRTSIELVRARLRELRSPYADLLEAVVAQLPKPTKAQVAAARRLAQEGPPAELVGLEPFAAGAGA
jgi:nitrate reductase molybdenum cofactor assembly chaperone NarJ/NarW